MHSKVSLRNSPLLKLDLALMMCFIRTSRFPLYCTSVLALDIAYAVSNSELNHSDIMINEFLECQKKI